MGRGSSWQELGGFEVPPELSRAQVIENATIIPQMFQTDSFSYEGKFVNIPPRNVIPKPIQKPSPPMWMACGSDDTYEIAGELGLGVLAFAAKSPDYVGERIRRYKEKVVDAKPVTGVVNNKTAAFCMMYCGESDDEADETAGPTVVWYQDVFARYYNPSQHSKYKGADHRTFDDDGNETVQSSGRMKVHQKRPKATHEQMKKLMNKARSSQGLCVGSAESITKVLKRYEANQIDQVLCIVQSGMLQHEDIQAVAEAVRPRGHARVRPLRAPGRPSRLAPTPGSAPAQRKEDDNAPDLRSLRRLPRHRVRVVRDDGEREEGPTLPGRLLHRARTQPQPSPNHARQRARPEPDVARALAAGARGTRVAPASPAPSMPCSPARR